MDAKGFLESKGFNIGDDMTVKALDNNIYTITKIVKNSYRDNVPMVIMLEKNIWEKSGEPRNPNLSIDDLYIIQVTNGTAEQEHKGDSHTNRGTGTFTEFIYDVVGDNPFYVKDPSPYWGKRFKLVEDQGKGRYFFGLIGRRNGNGIKKYKKHQEVSGGTRRRRRRRRRKTRVVKRNKKKRMTRKIKKRKRTTKKRKGTRRYY